MRYGVGTTVCVGCGCREIEREINLAALQIYNKFVKVVLVRRPASRISSPALPMLQLLRLFCQIMCATEQEPFTLACSPLKGNNHSLSHSAVA